MDFEVERDINETVYVYYGLDNFYQSHRQYAKSRDNSQLLGNEAKALLSKCDPLRVDPEGKTIAPCGLVANSMFNDSFVIGGVPMSRKNISWDLDRDLKYKNPEPKNNTKMAFSEFSKPPSWSRRVEELDPSNPGNNGYHNEDFQVWMRTAAFPKFQKLYGRLSNLPKGNYTVDVSYNYPVAEFNGRKKIV